MSDESKKSKQFIPDALLMNSYTYIFCIFIVCFGIFFIYNSYSLEADFNNANCNNQTVKTAISVMQISSWIMVVLTLIIFEGTIFKVFFDRFRIIFLILLVLYTVTMITCSAIIKNNITTSCLGSYYNNTLNGTNNSLFVSSIGLVLATILYGVFLGFNVPTYYPAGTTVLISNDIVIRKLSTPDKDGNRFYPEGNRLSPFDDEGYKKVFKSIHPDPVVCAPPKEKKKEQKIVISLPQDD